MLVFRRAGDVAIGDTGWVLLSQGCRAARRSGMLHATLGLAILRGLSASDFLLTPVELSEAPNDDAPGNFSACGCLAGGRR